MNCFKGSRDELNLEEIGQKKCALFIITPQANTTYNFIAAELYTQLFDILYKQGHKKARQTGTVSVKLDVPVRMIIDEAGNVGNIPHLENTISTCRKYNLSIALIYQNKAQIEVLFEKKWETLVGNESYISPKEKESYEGMKKPRPETREDKIDRFLNADETDNKDTDDEEEIINMLKEKKINLSPAEILNFLRLNVEDRSKVTEVLEGYDPYSEFDFV